MLIVRVVFLILFLLSAATAEPLSKEAVKRILPTYEAFVEKARQDWGVPQVAVAVVYKDELLWWKGFGEKTPDLETVFAIGSTTKAFTAATLALMIDEQGAEWDSKVVDLLPEFAMFDPWVTREFQVEDLLTQHSGLLPQALSQLGIMGYSSERIWRALRWVEPSTSFRSSFAYVNTPHLVAGELVKRWAKQTSWEDVLTSRLLRPLGMNSTTWTAVDFDRSTNRADGHVRINKKVRSIPTGPFPYVFGPAGALNSNLHDMARWVRFQLGKGEFEGTRLISENNLLRTWRPNTVMNDKMVYAMGWINQSLQGKHIVWHNGGTPGHTTFVGMDPDEDLGLIVLSNLGGTSMPDAVGLQFFQMVHQLEGPDFNQAFLGRRSEPQEKPLISAGMPTGILGKYQHPALGQVTVSDNFDVLFEEPNLKAKLEPIGANLYRLRASDAWMKQAGWDDLGEALYTPKGVSKPAALTVFLGTEGQGSTFRMEQLVP